MTPSDIALLPEDRSIALLLRHAERPPIPPGQLGNELGLTPDGRRAARALGASIGSRLRSLSTSPVHRCRETAEHIRMGAGIAVDLRDDRLLGGPGAFVADAEIAWRNWEALGNTGVVEHLAGSDEPLPGMHPPGEATRRLHAHLLDQLDDGNGLHVFVTHDVVLAPFASRMVGRPGALWPRWLQGVALWRDRTSVRVAWDGRVWPDRPAHPGGR